MSKTYYVYTIINTWNQKQYIGITNSFENRKKQHFDKNYRKRDKKKLLYQVMNKFDESFFKMELIFQNLLKEEAVFAESFLINYIPTYISFGYNKSKEKYLLKHEEKMRKENPSLIFKLKKYVEERKKIAIENLTF